MRDATIIDEFTLVSILCFMASCIFSFMSLKIIKIKLSQCLEGMADNIFFAGLLMMFITTLIATSNFIK